MSIWVTHREGRRRHLFGLEIPLPLILSLPVLLIGLLLTLLGWLQSTWVRLTDPTWTLAIPLAIGAALPWLLPRRAGFALLGFLLAPLIAALPLMLCAVLLGVAPSKQLAEYSLFAACWTVWIGYVPSLIVLWLRSAWTRRKSRSVPGKA